MPHEPADLIDLVISSIEGVKSRTCLSSEDPDMNKNFVNLDPKSFITHMGSKLQPVTNVTQIKHGYVLFMRLVACNNKRLISAVPLSNHPLLSQSNLVIGFLGKEKKSPHNFPVLLINKTYVSAVSDIIQVYRHEDSDIYVQTQNSIYLIVCQHNLYRLDDLFLFQPKPDM